MTCEELQPQLAGYVDDEISSDERQVVEAHLAECQACRDLLAEQLAAVRAYAGYPVEEASEADWAGVWTGVVKKLPVAARRISLESLTDLDIGNSFEAEPEAPRPAGQPAATVAGQSAEAGASAAVAAESQPAAAQRPWAAGGTGHPHKGPVFKPLLIPRLRYMFWAHVAGLAAAVLIIGMVLLSVRPVIYTDQLASGKEIEIGFDVTASGSAPMVFMLRADDGREVPMIWVDDPGQDNPGVVEEHVQ